MNQRCVISGPVCSWLLCVTGLGYSAEFDTAKVAAIRGKMQHYVDEHAISGAVTVIGSHDGPVYIEAIGKQDVEADKPMVANSLFRIASMTKPITAMGIMILDQEKLLSVNDPVAKYIPEFRGQKLVVGREGDTVKLGDPARPITIRDLLTHTSGLPGGFPAPNNDLYFKRQLTLKEAVDISAHQPLDFEPGSKWAYCNSGIDTLGRIIEIVSGQSYESFLKTRIFIPLKMTDTTFYPTDEQLKRLAGLYDLKEGKLNPVGYVLLGPARDAKHPIPAGGLYSTGPDLAKLYQCMLNRGVLDTHRILTGHSVLEMTKVQTAELECGFTPGMGFGYGWAVIRKPQGVHSMLSPGTYGHGGAFGTQAWLDPQQDLFVVLLIQRVGLANGDASDLRRDLQLVAVDALKKPNVEKKADIKAKPDPVRQAAAIRRADRIPRAEPVKRASRVPFATRIR